MRCSNIDVPALTRSVLLFVGLTLAPPAVAQDEIVSAIGALVASPHGFPPNDDMSMTVFRPLADKPADVAEALRKLFPVSKLDEGDDEFERRFENAVLLAAAVRAPETDGLLTDWYLDLGEQRNDLGGAVEPPERLQYLILDATRDRFSKPILESIVKRWEAASPRERTLTASYLADAARDQPEAAETISRLLDEMEARSGIGLLRETLDAIER